MGVCGGCSAYGSSSGLVMRVSFLQDFSRLRLKIDVHFKAFILLAIADGGDEDHVRGVVLQLPARFGSRARLGLTILLDLLEEDGPQET
jgi:hypothetical protein